MKIKQFIKNKLKEIEKKQKTLIPAKEVEIEKNKLLEDRFEDVRDPLVAERVTTAELKTFLQLYSSYPWVYIAANAIATAGASVPFQLLVNGKETENADEHAPYLNKPNPNMTWYELIETTLLHLELAGNCYWEVVRDKKTPGKDKILAIYPLRPDRMKIIPDTKKKIKEYEYMINNSENTIHFAPDEIIHLKYTDALSEYYGVPPIACVKNEITLDFNATTWNKNFFKNGAEPGGVLETDKSLTPQAWERLKLNWFKRHKGVDKAGEVAILEEGLKYRQITSKHADMQYYDMKAWCRDVVLAALRVPPVILGISQKLSVGTERDQKKIFWYNNVIPKLTKLQHVINTFLMPEGIEFIFIVKAIDSVVEDDQVKTTIVQSNIAHGVMTINEARKKYYGMDPVEWGDTWWRPVGLVDVENPIVALPSETGSPNGQKITSGDRAGLSGPSKVPNVNTKGKTKDKKKSVLESFVDIEKIEVAEPNWDDKDSVRDYEELTILKSHAGPDEKKLRNIMIQFFHEQSVRILAKVETGWPIQKADEPLDDNYMDEKQENTLLYGAIIASLFAFYKKYGVLLMDDLDPSKRFDVTKDYVRIWIEKHAGEMVSQVNETTKELIRSQLLQAYDNQESLQQVYERLSQVLTGDPSMWRVFKIARTELLTLTNNARLEAAKQSGVVQKKRWVCALLPTSRERAHGENHVSMHNQIVKFDEKFKAPRRGGGFDMMLTPGDITAHPENRVNCLCYVSFYSGTEEFKDINLGKSITVDAQTSGKYDIEKLAQDLGIHLTEEIKKANENRNPDVNVTVNMPEGMIKQDLKFPEMPKIDVKVDNHVDIPKQEAPIVKMENKVEVNPTPVNIEVKASDVKSPDIKIENNVDVQPTPVNFEKTEQVINVHVPQQASPIVNVEVKPTDVNVQVNPELTMKPTTEITEVFRDDKNRITGSRKDIKPTEDKE